MYCSLVSSLGTKWPVEVREGDDKRGFGEDGPAEEDELKDGDEVREGEDTNA